MTRGLWLKEAAEKLDCHPETLRRWIKFGYRGVKLPAKKIGRDWNINESSLENFINKTGNGRTS